jgi:hypothetical protein
MAHQYFVFDDLLRPSTLIEGYESFIWTERYSSAGDFQIVTKSTHETRTLLMPETYIGRVGSTYVMKIDTVSDDTATDGSRKLTITGKSLEALLDDRVAMPGTDDLTTTPNWVLNGTPGDIARELFNRVCVEAAIDPGDSIPFYQFGQYNPPGSLGESQDLITVTAAPDTLYSTLKQLCDTYSLGFRFVYAPPAAVPVTGGSNNAGSIKLKKKRLAGAGTHSGSFGATGSIKLHKKKLAGAGSLKTGGSSFPILHLGANGGPDGASGQTQAQFADAQTQIGPGTVAEIFYNTTLNPWTSVSSSGITPSVLVAAYPNVIPILCWNDSMTQAQMTTFINSVPAGQTVILCWRQEAENDASFANGGEFLNGVAGNSLLAGWNDQANKIRSAKGTKNILTAVSSTWGRYMPTGNATDGSWLPPLSLTDYYFFHVYQHQAGGFQNGATTWPTQGLANHSGYQTWKNLVKAKGGKMGITEYGVDLDAGSASVRATRIALDYNYLKNAFAGGSDSPFQLFALLYWWHNMANANTDYKFTDTTAINQWKAFSAEVAANNP